MEGNLYALVSRNLTSGVYRGDKVGGFIGIREKMGDRYLATEYHWDTDSRYGTARPVLDLGPCPHTDLREYLGFTCSGGRVVERKTTPSHFRPSRYGGDVQFTDYHLDDGSRVEDGLNAEGVAQEEDDSVFLAPNEALFAWLESQGS